MDEDNPLGLKNSQEEGLDRKETSLLIEPALAQSETNVNNLYAKQTNGVFNFPKQIVNVPAGLKHCHLQEASSNLRQRKKDLCTPVFFFFSFLHHPFSPSLFSTLILLYLLQLLIFIFNVRCGFRKRQSNSCYCNHFSCLLLLCSLCACVRFYFSSPVEPKRQMSRLSRRRLRQRAVG